MDIKGVIFDKDGTLFDFDATWGGWCRDMLAGLAQNDRHLVQLAAAIGYVPERRSFLPNSPVVADTPELIAARLLVHLPRWQQGALVSHLNGLAEVAPQVPIVPLGPVLDALLARGLALGVATNDGAAPARAHLSGAGVIDRFAFVSGSDSGHGAKPDPGPLLAFARATRLAPGRVAMVGDSAHDLRAARAAGMVAVAVTGPQKILPGLMELADVVLPDIAALPAWLDGLK